MLSALLRGDAFATARQRAHDVQGAAESGAFTRRSRAGQPTLSLRRPTICKCYGAMVNRRSLCVVSRSPTKNGTVSCWSALLIGALAWGCAPPPPVADGGDTGDGGAGIVELGTGQLEWETLPAADPTVELIYGAQGGFHVWGRGRFSTFQPDVDVSFRAVRESDGQELHHPSPIRRFIEGDTRYGLAPTADGRLETMAELVILTLDCPRDLVGQRLRIELTVRERATGRSATTQRFVRVIDEIPSPPGCLSERDGTRSDAALNDATASVDR